VTDTNSPKGATQSGYQPIQSIPATGPVLLLDDFGPQVWDAEQYHHAMSNPSRPGLPKAEAERCTHWAALPTLPDKALVP
jgi:hypothetical protein